MGYGSRTFEIEAATREEAGQSALEIAPNYSFSDRESDYILPNAPRTNLQLGHLTVDPACMVLVAGARTLGNVVAGLVANAALFAVLPLPDDYYEVWVRPEQEARVREIAVPPEPGTPSDEQYVAAAERLYYDGGTIEIDNDARVSRTAGNLEQGAYVLAWVWVEDAEALAPATPEEA